MEKNKYDVFVSYAREDGEFVASLLSRLNDENIRAFADRAIESGDNWLSRLEYAFRESEMILFIVSPHSLKSKWVHVEAGAAWILEKKMFPVLLGADISDLVEFLRLRQIYDLKNRSNIEGLVEKLRDIFKRPKASSIVTNPAESFNSIPHWDRLLHIGDWTRDKTTDELTGAGMHTYLLSHFEHGPSFTLTARFRILDPRPVSKIDAVNAGIVLGWTIFKNVRRYYNLLLTGKRLLLELVGGRGGGEYEDFFHINEGVPFALRENHEYTFSITASPGLLKVSAHGNNKPTVYEVPLAEPLKGRVGMRPWRSRMVCSQFDVITL